MQWETANTYCNYATFNGQTDWRLPTQSELNGLVNSGVFTGLFGDPWSGNLTWTSTVNGTGEYYYVHTNNINFKGYSVPGSYLQAFNPPDPNTDPPTVSRWLFSLANRSPVAVKAGVRTCRRSYNCRMVTLVSHLPCLSRHGI